MIEGELPVQPTQPSMAIQRPSDNEEGKNARAEANPAPNTKSRSSNEVPPTPDELVDNYEYVSKLGEGTYGVVYKAKEFSTDNVVAVKEIKIDHCDDGIPSTAIREIAVLQELRNNSYIVNLKEIIHGNKKNRLWLVFEYFNQDMKKFLDKLSAPLDA